MIGIDRLVCILVIIITVRSQIVCNDEECTDTSTKYTVYRYGVPHEIGSFTTFEELLDAVRVATSDIEITVLRKLNSILINSIEDLPTSFIALNNKELFCWPTFKEGYVHDTTGLTDRDIKITTLAIRPRIFLIENFLSDEEADALISKSLEKGMQESSVYTSEKDKFIRENQVRTSSNTYLDPFADNFPILSNIRERAINITTLPYTYSEQLQVIHYNKNQHYHAHYDWVPKHIKPTNQKPLENRYITLLFYLNTVEEGGETVFPFTNPNYTPARDGYATKVCSPNYPAIKIKPIKGNAIMFYNMPEKGHMDDIQEDFSLHGGCDVIKGEKWAANYWVHNMKYGLD